MLGACQGRKLDRGLPEEVPLSVELKSKANFSTGVLDGSRLSLVLNIGVEIIRYTLSLTKRHAIFA